MLYALQLSVVLSDSWLAMAFGVWKYPADRRDEDGIDRGHRGERCRNVMWPSQYADQSIDSNV
jgi:hypothetical protein